VAVRFEPVLMYIRLFVASTVKLPEGFQTFDLSELVAFVEGKPDTAALAVVVAKSL
jgi:hypothetical protein